MLVQSPMILMKLELGASVGPDEGAVDGFCEFEGNRDGEEEGVTLGAKDSDGEVLGLELVDGLLLGYGDSDGLVLGHEEIEGNVLGDAVTVGFSDGELDGMKLGESVGVSEG